MLIAILALFLKSILDILGVWQRFFFLLSLRIIYNNSPDEVVEHRWWRVFLLLWWSSWSNSLWSLLLFVLFRGLRLLIISGWLRWPDDLNGCNNMRRFTLSIIITSRTPPLSLEFPGLPLLFMQAICFRFGLFFGIWFFIFVIIREIMLFTYQFKLLSIIFLLFKGLNLIYLLNDISHIVSLRILFEY